MMRRMRRLFIPVLVALTLTTAFLALASAAPIAQQGGGGAVRECEAGLQRSADPMVLYVDEESLVTSIITGTCFPIDLPIDITIVVDQSNSMTKGNGGSLIDTPAPGQTPPGITTPPPNIVPTNNVPPPQPGTPPPPKPTIDPGPLPTMLFEQPSQPIRPAGLSQIVITETPRPLPTRYTPGPSPTIDPRTREIPTSPPGIALPTQQTIRRDTTEAPGDEDLIRAVQEAVRDFLGEIEDDVKVGRFRVGLVAFNDRAVELSPLTDDVQQVRSRLTRVRGQGNTRVDLGLSAAVRQLVGVGIRGRDDLDHKKLVVVFSDGKFDRRTTARLRTREEIDIITVAAGRGADRAAMRQIASEPEYALEINDRKGLVELVRRFKPNQRPVTMDTMTVEDVVASNMSLVGASVNPPADRAPDARTLQWDFAPPSFPITITYRVRPQEVGQHPVSENAHATWSDSQKRNGDAPFPVVSLDVRAVPTPTETPVPTLTSTVEIPPTVTPTVPKPTAAPQAAYLPRLFRNPAPEPTKPCIPSEQLVDVALVIDTSTSMNDPTQQGGMPKLQAAIEAAVALVSLLKAQDQTAVVGFNIEPTLATVLTSDKAQATGALQQLAGGQQQGTRIDLGLATALEELQSQRHQPDHHRSIILVTDGRQVGGGGNDAVRAVAAQIKDSDITIVTVGLGADVDAALLREIASKPEYFYEAPNAESLLDIYREIAQFIPCP